jgi:hypothetical protein
MFLRVIIFAIGLCTCAGSMKCKAQDDGLVPTISADDAHRMAVTRQDGLSRDQSRVPTVVAMLRNPKHRYDAYTALRALSHLSPVNAVVYTDEFLAATQDERHHTFLLAVRARVMAQQSASGIADPRIRAQTIVDRMFQELGINPDGATLVARSFTESKPLKGYKVPIEVYAIRELADLAYTDRELLIPEVARSRGIGFEHDYPSLVKEKLAAKSAAERIRLLVDDLSKKSIGRGNACYDYQLLIDIGADAGQAVVAKIEAMRKNRQFESEIGFVSLFDVLKGLGDKASASVLESFLSDESPQLRYFALQNHGSLVKGLKYQWRAGY